MPKQEPLMQVEVPLFFSPMFQSGGVKRPSLEVLGKCDFGWMTVDVYGTKAIGELSGRPVLEDSRFEVNGEDIEDKLPDAIIQAISDYVLDFDG